MRDFDLIMEELGWPRIFLVSAKQFEKVTGDKLGSACGMSNVDHSMITIHKGMKGKALKNTLWHEILHILYPHWRHWKIEAAAERLARGGGRGFYCFKYRYTIDDVPNRREILVLARRAVIRHNRLHRVKGV